MDDNATYVLAVDLGTSGPKVALFTTQGRLAGYEFEATPYYLFPNGGAEQKPDEWWQAIVKASQRLLRGLAIDAGQVRAVCCTTQWSGTVAVDRDGSALMNAIIWMDARGAPYARQITSGPLQISGYGVDKLYTWLKYTGGVPGLSGKDPIAHILYLKHEHPQIYAQTYKFLEPKDYINLRLTGLFAASYDSITLHWLTDNRDLTRVDYHPRLLALAGVPREKFPDLKRAVDVLGPLIPSAAGELGLAPGTPVVMGTPDIPSAALGSGAAGDYEMHLYVGTSSWLGCHVPFKKTDVLHNIASLPSAIPGRYLLTDEQETSGACLNFLRDNIFYHSDELLTGESSADVYKNFDRIVERTPPGSGGLIFTPWLYGERAPVDEHTLRAGFYNLSLGSTREHIIRAVFEGVAFNIRWLLGYVEKFINRQADNIHIVGGGAKSAVWCQIFADVLNRNIQQVKDPILANVRGAAFLACAALGTLSFDNINSHTEITQVCTPNPDHRTVYDQAYREFLHIYRANSPIYARMNHR